MRRKIRCDGKSTVLLQNFLDLNWALVVPTTLISQTLKQMSLPACLLAPTTRRPHHTSNIYNNMLAWMHAHMARFGLFSSDDVRGLCTLL
jgi:hypothetical protein